MQKPKLLVFRPQREKYPLNNHHVFFDKFDKLYDEFFEFKIIEGAADYKEVVKKFNPDLCLFQFIAFSINIPKNIDKNDNIPKIGLGVIDGSDFRRGIFYRSLSHIGVDYFIHIALSMGAVQPELRNNIFYLPHFIDEDLNKDFNRQKLIPILFVGNFDKKFYPWRYDVFHTIKDKYPALRFDHPGYRPTNKMLPSLGIQGEKYFEAINSSYLVPTSSSIKNTLIMKHLEIPASRSCMVTKYDSTLSLFGFKDMENCVFASPENIVEKIQYLFENPEELKRITDNGYEFVHNNHTHKNRRQILQLYELLKEKKPGQKIIQTSIFGDLELVEEVDPRETIHIRVSDEIEWIYQVDKDIAHRNFVRAERECKRIIDIADYMHDAKLRLYLIHMLNGRKKYASAVLSAMILPTARCSVIIDPIDHTLLIIHLLSLRQLDQAVMIARMGILIRRHETDIARLLAFNISGKNEYSRLLRNVMSNSVVENEIKSIYYFYAKEFNFLEILKDIISRNIKYEEVKDFSFSISPKNSERNKDKLKLNKVKVEYDDELIRKLLAEIDTDIRKSERIIRKAQDSYYQMTKIFGLRPPAR